MVDPVRASARPSTSAVIAVCTLVFFGAWIASGVRAGGDTASTLVQAVWNFDEVPLLESLGALAATRVWLDLEWWRVASAGFLHGSWLHLGLNMVGLWSVGQWTELAWGGWRQLLVFLVASVGGCAASLMWAEAPLVVGASAGIFGIAGGLVVARAWGRGEVREAIAPVSARTLAFWLLFWLALGAILPWVFGISLLAQAGHIGGLLFGTAAGLACSIDRRRRWVRWSLWGTVAAGLGGVLWLGAEPTWRPNYHVFMGSELLERRDFEAAAAHFDEALERAGGAEGDPELANAVAYALAEAGVDLERAERLVRSALASKPDSADFLDTFGWVLCQRGEVEAGKGALRQAQEAATREIPEIGDHLQRCGE
jgi:membrane associated rhomboid family serine protease